MFQEQDKQESNFFLVGLFFDLNCLAISEPTYHGALLLIIHVGCKYFAEQIILCAVDLPNFVQCEGCIQNSALSKFYFMVKK